METVEGSTLDHVTQQGPMAIDRACRLTMELLDVLHNVHEHGYVHRDVKPSNIILEPLPQGGERIRLIDFGVSKVFTRPRDATAVTQVAITAVGEIVGTPAYMAPEQLTGRNVDARADVHAAGIVLYELLNGTWLRCCAMSCPTFGRYVRWCLRRSPTSSQLPRPRTRRRASTARPPCASRSAKCSTICTTPRSPARWMVRGENMRRMDIGLSEEEISGLNLQKEPIKARA